MMVELFEDEAHKFFCPFSMSRDDGPLTCKGVDCMAFAKTGSLNPRWIEEDQKWSETHFPTYHCKRLSK